MELKIIRWAALLIGSGLSVPFVGMGIFAAGSFMSGIVGDSALATDGPLVIDLEWIMELIGILTAFLIPMAVVLAWFRNKTGGYLITVFAILHIMVSYEPEVAWMQIAVLPVGPLLLLYVYYNNRLMKKGEA